jgi:hypothetical protein
MQVATGLAAVVGFGFGRVVVGRGAGALVVVVVVAAGADVVGTDVAAVVAPVVPAGRSGTATWVLSTPGSAVDVRAVGMFPAEPAKDCVPVEAQALAENVSSKAANGTA